MRMRHANFPVAGVAKRALWADVPACRGMGILRNYFLSRESLMKDSKPAGFYMLLVSSTTG